MKTDTSTLAAAGSLPSRGGAARGRRPNTKPRRATVLEVVVLLAVSLAGFAGTAALVHAFSFREIHFAPRASELGADAVVQWRFLGVKVWQQRFPRIVDVQRKTITWRAEFDPSDSHPAPEVDVLVVFLDQEGQAALTLRHTSLLREVIPMHAYLAAANPGTAGTIFRETERWWASNPVSDVAGGAVGMLVGMAIGVFFLAGGLGSLSSRFGAVD